MKVKPQDDVQFSWYFPSAAVKAAMKRVEQGDVLKDGQRRQCVKFLCSMGEYTPEELAAFFRVDESVIVADLAAIVESRNAVIGSVNPVDFIAEHIDNQMYAIKKIRETMESGEVKGKTMLLAADKYSIANLRLLEALQSLGALPKELGSMNVVTERWVASIDEATGAPQFQRIVDGTKQQGLLGIEQVVEGEVIDTDVEDV